MGSAVSQAAEFCRPDYLIGTKGSGLGKREKILRFVDTFGYDQLKELYTSSEDFQDFMMDIDVNFPEKYELSGTVSRLSDDQAAQLAAFFESQQE